MMGLGQIGALGRLGSPKLAGGNWWLSESELDLDFANNRAFNRSTGFNGSPNGILTYTSPSPKLVYGDDGVLGYAPHNLIPNSSMVDAAPPSTLPTGWSTGTTAGLTRNVIGKGTEYGLPYIDIQYVGTTSSTSFGSTPLTVASGAPAGINGEVFTFAWDYRVVGGTTANVSLAQARIDEYTAANAYVTGANNTGETIDETFRTTTYTRTLAGGGTVAKCAAFMRFVCTNGAAVDITIRHYAPRFNRGPTAFSYITTTSAAVYSLPIDHDPITFDPLGVLIEEQRVNLCLYSDDFTNAAWVKSNLTAAKTATGPDGVANSASTLTATAANATALQAITSTSAARITSMFVKRRTGTGAIEMTQDNGSTWTAVTVTAGWTRVNIASATAANPTVGIRIVTSGDAIDVDLFQHELGAFITSPVPTVASQVTRAADQVSVLASAFAWNNSAGTFAVDANVIQKSVGASGYFAACAGAGGNNNTHNLYRANPNEELQIRSGSSTVAAIQPAGATGSVKMAYAYTVDDYAISKNGNAVGSDTLGAVPVDVDRVQIGTVAGGNYANGHIKRLTYWNTRKTNAELQALSA